MTRRFSLRRIFAAVPLLALAGILLSAAGSRAEDPPEQRHRMENRFLFVIDTASAMKSRTNGLEESVIGLLSSGMHGQLRKGDTIGLWTYSDQLDTDFPMQIWSEQKKLDIVSDVRDHLRELHFQKRAHLDKAMAEINKVVAHSERVTVILMFDGSELIKGTPFDKDVNDLHKQYLREFKAAHAPFVTVLAGRDGALFDYTINYPGTVVIPPTADPLPPPPVVQNTPPAAPPPPVVVSPPPEPRPPPHRIEITLIGSNSAHNASAPPAPPIEVAPVVLPAPAPALVAITNAPSPAIPAPVEAQPVNKVVTPPELASPPPSAPPPAPMVMTEAKPLAVSPPVAAAPSTAQQVAMFVMAFSLFTIAVVLVIFLVRRSRAGTKPSLISQSIDRSR